MTSYTLPLFSEAQIEVFQEPFIYGYIDNFLPESVYSLLETNFIQPADQCGEVLSAGKQRLTFEAPSSIETLDKNRPWRDFVGEISSSRYRKDMLNWLRNQFTASKQNNSVYGELMRRRFDIDPELTHLHCEFSSLSKNALLLPHTDSPTKYMGCVLYFAPDDWKSEWGGATEVYAAKKKKYQFNWFNYGLPYKFMDHQYSAEFKRNRLFFLVKSYNSWHGLGAIRAPANIPRRSFNFSLAVPRGLSSDWDLNFGEREIKRLEARKFFMPKLERDVKARLEKLLPR